MPTCLCRRRLCPSVDQDEPGRLAALRRDLQAAALEKVGSDRDLHYNETGPAAPQRLFHCPKAFLSACGFDADKMSRIEKGTNRPRP